MEMTTHTTTDANSRCDEESADLLHISFPQMESLAYANGAENEDNTLTMTTTKTRHESRSMEDERELSPAEKVFGVAELAEKILLKLEPLDIISTSNIYRSISAAIWDSPTIRRLLFLEPQNGKSLRLPLDVFARKKLFNIIMMRWTHEDGDIGNHRIGLQVLIGPPPDPEPVLGSLLRAMLISDPPVHCVDILSDCYACEFTSRNGPNHPQPEKLVNETGLTFGDLLSAAEQA
jgi:hypothetical protein